MTLSITAAIALGAGCGAISDGGPTGDGETATVQVVHAVPDAPAVDVYVAGDPEPVIAGLAFGLSSAALAVPAGIYQFEIRAAAAAPESVPLLTTDPVELEVGASLTLAAVGLLDGTGNNDQLRVLALDSTTFETPAPDSVTVRIVHASPDAPTVALDLGDDGTVEYENIERFATSSSGGVQLRAETEHQLAIYAGHPLARVTAFTIPPLARGSQLFMIATGKIASEPRAGDGFSILSLPPLGSEATTTRIRQNPIVHLVHAGADAPAVDLDASGVSLVRDLAFGQVSSPIQVPPGDYDLAIFPAGATGQPVASSHTPILAAGDEVLAIATGLLAPSPGEGAFEVLYFVDEIATGDVHSARLRAVHASPDAPAVDISPLAASGELATPLLESAIAFGSAGLAEGLSVPAAPLRIGIAAAGTPAPVASFDVVTGPGQRTYVIAAGSLSGLSSRAPFQLLTVETSGAAWTVASLAPVADH